MLHYPYAPKVVHISLLALLGLAALLGPAMAAAAEAGVVNLPPPSANKGKIGSYHCTTKHAGYDYWVCAPAKYSDDAPAGLHLFFHGQNNQDSAPVFDRWERHFLTPYNLVAINMQYNDGNNFNDTAGKVAAAQEAIAQTMADYHIIAGRGVIACFSGGGATHGLFAQQSAKVRGYAWPFCQSISYSSTYQLSAVVPVPMTWYIGAGTKEWDGRGKIGPTAVKRADELFKALGAGACPDIFFQVIQGKEHTIAEKDIEVAATLFPRADLAFAPFIYAPDYAEADLQPVVEQLNRLELQAGLARLDRLLKGTGGAAKVKAKAATLKAAAEARIDQVVEMVKGLIANDPLLGNWYGNLVLRQIKDNPKEKDLRALLTTAAKAKPFQACLAADQEFFKLFPTIFGSVEAPLPELKPEMIKQLTDLLPSLNPQTEIGRMITSYLPEKPAGK